jgi:hypothetical protein
MLKWIGYILIAALVLAAITSPTEKKFQNFVYNKVDTTNCKPFVQHQAFRFLSVPVFSMNYVRECKRTNTLRDLKTGQPIGILAVPVYGDMQRYLGLFGTFWKLK